MSGDPDWADAKSGCLVGARFRCEVRLPGCWMMATDAHHRRLRGIGGSRAPDRHRWLSACCRPCHDAVHANPAWATLHGWIISRWAEGEPESPVRCTDLSCRQHAGLE